MTRIARMTALQEILTSITGVDVEITIRGERDFTFSTEIADQDLEFHLAQYFGDAMKVSAPTQIDNECGTFVYMTAA